MKQTAFIAGVGMTAFGKHLDRSLKSLSQEAVMTALRDAGIEKDQLEAAWIGTAAASVITGQVCVPGQVVLRSMGIGKIPVVNVENACATAATAFQQAATMVTLGAYDVALALGVEKLYSEDKAKTFSVFSGAVDIEKKDELIARMAGELEVEDQPVDRDAASKRSLFVDIYASLARKHMREYGTTVEQLAAVSSKNSRHGSLNPKAQYQQIISVDEVLRAREVAWPLTLPMCSPIGDGAAAAIIVSERKARQLGMSRMVKIEASSLFSGWDYQSNDPDTLPEKASVDVYNCCGIGPTDLSCVELHDASAISEIMYYEFLGLCEPGEGGKFVEEGHSSLGGRLPVNTSGGLMRKGHPIGATGTSQIVELVEQLRGEAGGRQINGARVALAENGGGYLGADAAALVLTMLSK